jgi:diguanylate cyclase (GGDEF)-like protein/PAS domain S-box-containing protein
MVKRNEDSFKSEPAPLLNILVLFLLLSVAVITAGYLFYQGQELLIKKQQGEMVSAVADLKVRQIVSWRYERLADATVVQKTIPMIRLIDQYYQKTTSAGNRSEILYWMKSIADSYGYESLVLLDLKKRVRLTTGHEVSAIGKEAAPFADRALQTGKILFSDFRWGEVIRIIRSDIYIPLHLSQGREERPIGVMILRTDPHRALYPLIQSWPTPSPTAETLLIRREGENVLFLNELRHKKDTALKFSLPLMTGKLPAAMAVRGFEGVTEGIDYRGVPVLSAVRAVNGTDMFIVSKIDADEVYAPLRRQVWMILVIIVAIICLAGAVLGFLWRKREAESYRILYESELQRQSLLARYEIITQNASDIIIMMDAEWKLVEVNERALQVYGYTREEMTGMNLSELMYPATLSAVDREIATFDIENNLMHETSHRCKDGAIIIVEVSASKLKIEGEIFFLELIRDITERKRLEEELREMSLHDLLTDLYNRRGFFAVAEQQVKAANRAKRKMSLTFFDCNDFKWINDSLGHRQGDKVLVDTAHILRQTYRESDIIARIGGDEFVVFSMDPVEVDHDEVSKRLQQNIDEYNAKEIRRYRLSLSWGTAVYDPESPISLDELISQADRLMYTQKKAKASKKS